MYSRRRQGGTFYEWHRWFMLIKTLNSMGMLVRGGDLSRLCDPACLPRLRPAPSQPPPQPCHARRRHASSAASTLTLPPSMLVPAAASLLEYLSHAELAARAVLVHEGAEGLLAGQLVLVQGEVSQRPQLAQFHRDGA